MARSSMTSGTSRNGEHVSVRVIMNDFMQNGCHEAVLTAFACFRIDEDRATKARAEMIRKKVIYGHSVPYRNMCRYNSGVSR